jgi:hypothetical protein
MNKPGLFVKAHGRMVGGVGQQSDAATARGACPADCLLQQSLAYVLPAPGRMDDKVFQPDRVTALGGADGEKNADHADYALSLRRAVNASQVRLFENEPKSTGLLPGIGLEVSLLRE